MLPFPRFRLLNVGYFPFPPIRHSQRRSDPVMTHFEGELQSLKERLLVMASRAEASMARAMDALVNRDDDLARRVREEDDAIDQLEKEIDEQAIRLLSKAPLATQLRLIVSNT